MKKLIRRPINGRNIMDFKATGRPKWSAITPRRVTPIPPVPIAKPAMRPEAMPRFLGRLSCAMTIVTVKLEISAMPMAPILTNSMTPAVTKISGNKALVRAKDRIKYRLCPHRSAKGAPAKVPTAPPRETPKPMSPDRVGPFLSSRYNREE